MARKIHAARTMLKDDMSDRMTGVARIAMMMGLGSEMMSSSGSEVARVGLVRPRPLRRGIVQAENGVVDRCCACGLAVDLVV